MDTRNSLACNLMTVGASQPHNLHAYSYVTGVITGYVNTAFKCWFCVVIFFMYFESHKMLLLNSRVEIVFQHSFSLVGNDSKPILDKFLLFFQNIHRLVLK
jgi:hypothetical protein